jgi:hypothetical protein
VTTKQYRSTFWVSESNWMIGGGTLAIWSLLSLKLYWAAHDPTGWSVSNTNRFLGKLVFRRSSEARISNERSVRLKSL